MLTVIAVTGFIVSNAQENSPSPEKANHNLYIGLGVGFDYGGIGFRPEFLPVKFLGIFGGVGYNFGGFGYNIGASFKVLPNEKVTPTVCGMYGYNAVIKIKNGNSLSSNTTIYYGPTFGAGMEVKLGKAKNKLAMSLLLPVRSSEFKTDYDYAKAHYGLSDMSPVGFSIGYNLALN
jgi:hypothetical protein